MRGLPVLLVAVGVALAGCAVDEEGPEEAVGEPAEPTPASPTPTTTTTPEPTPEAPTPTTAAPEPTPAPTPTTPPLVTTTPAPPPPPPPATPPPSPATTTPPPPAPSPTPGPAPEPEPACPTPERLVRADCWPREGSHVSYRTQMATGAPDGSWRLTVDATATWTFRDGDWRGVCEGTRHEFYETRGWENTTVREEFSAQDPPHWPLFNDRDVTPGEHTEAWHLSGCHLEHEDLAARGATTTADGVDAWFATEHEEESPYSDHHTEWERDTGLVLRWDFAYRNTRVTGELTSTDAPLG